MEKKEPKIPEEIIKELDINEVDEIPSNFDVTAIVESHQVKLPVPRKLMKNFDLEFKKGQKLKLKFNDKNKELIYKI